MQQLRQLLSILLERRCVTPHLLKQAAAVAEYIDQGESMIELARQRQRFLAALQGLVRVAQTPQATSIIRQSAHPGVRSSQEYEGAMVLRRVVEGNDLLKVMMGW